VTDRNKPMKETRVRTAILMILFGGLPVSPNYGFEFGIMSINGSISTRNIYGNESRVLHTLEVLAGFNYTFRFASCVAEVLTCASHTLKITLRASVVVLHSNYTFRFASGVAKVIDVCFAHYL